MWGTLGSATMRSSRFEEAERERWEVLRASLERAARALKTHWQEDDTHGTHVRRSLAPFLGSLSGIVLLGCSS